MALAHNDSSTSRKRLSKKQGTDLSTGTKGKARRYFDDRYEILSIIGRGNESVVYLGRPVDESVNQLAENSTHVALKVLLGSSDVLDLKRALRDEGIAARACEHDNVVKVFDFRTSGKISYLAFEYAPHGDLAAFVASQSDGMLPGSMVEPLLLNALDAIATIHQRGILHRDLRPQNFLITESRALKVCDFGKVLLPGTSLESAPSMVWSQDDDLVAPEVKERGAFDYSSDLYGVGTSFLKALYPTFSVQESRDKVRDPYLVAQERGIRQEVAILLERLTHPSRKHREFSAKQSSDYLIGKGELPPVAIDASHINTPLESSTSDGPLSGKHLIHEAENGTLSNSLPAGEGEGSRRRAQIVDSGRFPHTTILGDTERRTIVGEQVISENDSLSRTTPVEQPIDTAQTLAEKLDILSDEEDTDEEDTSSASSFSFYIPPPSEDATTNHPGQTQFLPSNIVEQLKGARTTENRSAEHEAKGLDETTRQEPLVNQVDEGEAESGFTIPQNTFRTGGASSLSSSVLHDEPSFAYHATREGSSNPGENEDLDDFIDEVLDDEEYRTEYETSARRLQNRRLKTVLALGLLLPFLYLVILPIVGGLKTYLPSPLARYLTSSPSQPSKTNESASQTTIVKKKDTSSDVKTAQQPATKKESSPVKSAVEKVETTATGASEVIFKGGLPRYTGAVLQFPSLPGGTFKGFLYDVVAGKRVPLTILSFPDRAQLAVMVEREGWTPTVVSIPENASELRVGIHGHVLKFIPDERGDKTMLKGTLEDVTTGGRGRWELSPQQ
jgi:serine/threonine protein kinase